MKNTETQTDNRKQYYRSMGYWGNATLADYWKMSVLSSPEKTAVVDSHGARYTYAELDAEASKIYAYLKQCGIKPGDYVSVMVPGWAEFTMIYIACLKAGAVINPICPGSQLSEITFMLSVCRSKILFIPSAYKKNDYSDYHRLLKQEIKTLRHVTYVDKGKDSQFRSILDNPVWDCVPEKSNAEDVAVVLFTSGTEGRMKGVTLTHNNIISAEKAFAAKINFTCFDTMLMPAPLGHATGFHHGVTMPFIFGSTSVLQDIFRPEEALRLIERERCTCGMGATPFVYDMFQSLKNKLYNINSMRFFLCGGAPIPRQLINEAMEYGFKILGVYGSTESVPHVSASYTDTADKIVNTDGTPVLSIETKIVDENGNESDSGEEWSRGPNVFSGYLDEPELTANVLTEDGWYKSGDICRRDADGYIRIIGRKKDMIVRGGENICCTEIENALLEHPAIKEAAVIAIPDKRMGERACAYLILNDDFSNVTIRELTDFFVAKGIAKFKCPERLEFMNILPRTESGKVQKFILKEDIKRKLIAECATGS